jgi:hypothetical protein
MEHCLSRAAAIASVGIGHKQVDLVEGDGFSDHRSAGLVLEHAIHTCDGLHKCAKLRDARIAYESGGTATVAQNTTIIKDTTAVTVDRDDTIHYDAAVAVQDGKVAAVGPSREFLARFPGAQVVDGAGKVVMPGFANIHTHFTLIIAKGVYEDLSPPHKPPFYGRAGAAAGAGTFER